MNFVQNQITGEYAARYFKFLSQFNNSFIKYKLPLNKIYVKSFYKKNQKQFDCLALICIKYNINLEHYLDFIINKLNLTEKNINTQLISINTFNKYFENLKIYYQYNKIYKLFLKSVENIVNDCVKLKITSVIDYLKYIIENKKIAQYYISGKISIYYFAAIPKFKKIIDNLDNISKNEFNLLYQRYDKYHFDINQAFLFMKNIKINPIKFTNNAIFKKSIC